MGWDGTALSSGSSAAFCTQYTAGMLQAYNTYLDCSLLSRASSSLLGHSVIIRDADNHLQHE